MDLTVALMRPTQSPDPAEHPTPQAPSRRMANRDPYWQEYELRPFEAVGYLPCPCEGECGAECPCEDQRSYCDEYCNCALSCACTSCCMHRIIKLTPLAAFFYRSAALRRLHGRQLQRKRGMLVSPTRARVQPAQLRLHGRLDAAFGSYCDTMY